MVQHLSIRIPWHDNGWNGMVCKRPELNQDCRVLRAVAKGKNDKVEVECAGQIFCERNNYMPPCLRESGTFMACNGIDTRPIEHPYTYDSRYSHIIETQYRINAFSFTARPYGWLLRENAKKMMSKKLHYTGYDDLIEVDVGSKQWVSNGINQEKIFDYFYRDVKVGASLAVAYAKSVPFVETAGRIILGIGIIESIEAAKEYAYNRKLGSSDIKSYLWERQIKHSIRPDRANGFLFPVDEIQKYLYDHPEQSPDELVVIAPDGYFDEFSYATEHLSYDALILVLNSTISVLKKYKQIGLSFGNGKDWDYCIKWCKEKLESLWQERGIFPGFGTVLCAAGLGYGYDIARAMREHFNDEELWERIPEVLANIKDYLPLNIPQNVLINIGKNQFNSVFKIYRPVLEMLSRINLTYEQAKAIIYQNNDSANNYDDIRSICENPYLLYEQTRLSEDKYRFSIGQIDIAVFPAIGQAFMDSADDERRIRAIAVSVLENEAQKGNTLLAADELVRQVNNFRTDIELELDISKFTLKALSDFFNSEFQKTSIKIDKTQKSEAYQLTRIVKIDETIRKFVELRVSEDLKTEEDWAKLLKTVISSSDNGEREKASHYEKLNAVKVMAGSKISVLTGGAGTGKTSTLVALCLSKQINNGKILILAPTGKARVVLESKLNEYKIQFKAHTVFSYLLQTAHCDPKTYCYCLSGQADNYASDATVIIDESSMLTEEMFGALAETIAHAKRVIFVGDPNQLPPIGAGKPFYELLQYLKKYYPKRVAELNVSNRQRVKDHRRADVEFAKLFTFDQAKETGEDIFDYIAVVNENIEFRRFNDNFAEVFLDTLKDALQMDNIEDIQKFDLSLGGTLNGEWMNFEPNAVKMVDSWQILSPYRNDAQTGSETLNRIIHQKYRLDTIPSALKKRKTSNPLGKDGVLFGEKVINLRNHKRNGYPQADCLNYVANGEIGLVERIFEKPKHKNNTHQVRFTSQSDYCYNYPSVISDEDSYIELAYALTVHKTQGSGFDATIFVVNEPQNGANIFISREMIYTALTRHTNKTYILYNKEPKEFKKYADSIHSDLARRLTNLFDEPSVHKIDDVYYADNLIHITRFGKRVRSKAEVIIANELHTAGIPFEYERKFLLPDGGYLLPDFTITQNNKEMIWEHLGMLSDPDYRKRWEVKKEEYAKCGITEANGNLIITSDNSDGGIDSHIIAEIIQKLK